MSVEYETSVFAKCRNSFQTIQTENSMSRSFFFIAYIILKWAHLRYIICRLFWVLAFKYEIDLIHENNDTLN